MQSHFAIGAGGEHRGVELQKTQSKKPNAQNLLTIVSSD